MRADVYLYMMNGTYRRGLDLPGVPHRDDVFILEDADRRYSTRVSKTLWRTSASQKVMLEVHLMFTSDLVSLREFIDEVLTPSGWVKVADEDIPYEPTAE